MTMSDDREFEVAPTARRQETRERLFDAAIEVFVELGVQSASVEAICARADFTRGAFYSNFSSKEELFLELLDREFAAHAAHLAQRARELEPILRERADQLTPEETASYVVEFLSPDADHVAWLALELELLLLAIRDPEIVTGRFGMRERLYRDIADPVEQIVEAAGRRFSVPVEQALSVFGRLVEDTVRASVLGGPPIGESLNALGERVVEMLFVLTEPLH